MHSDSFNVIAIGLADDSCRGYDFDYAKAACIREQVGDSCNVHSISSKLQPYIIFSLYKLNFTAMAWLDLREIVLCISSDFLQIKV